MVGNMLLFTDIQKSLTICQMVYIMISISFNDLRVSIYSIFLSITKENREIGVLSFGDGAVRTNPGNEIINISDVDKNSFRR